MDFSRLTDPEAYKMAMANLLRSGKSVGTAFQNEANKNYGLMDYAVAPLEVPLTVASGAVAPFLGVGKGIYQNMAQGNNNRVDNPKLAQSFMYNPSSPVSQDIVASMGNMLQQSKLPAYTPMLGTVASKAPQIANVKPIESTNTVYQTMARPFNSAYGNIETALTNPPMLLNVNLANKTGMDLSRARLYEAQKAAGQDKKFLPAGQGVWESSTGMPEYNPVFIQKFAKSTAPVRNQKELGQFAQLAENLEQEGAGVARFVPQLINDPKNASAAMLSNIGPAEIKKLGEAGLSGQMVMAARPNNKMMIMDFSDEVGKMSELVSKVKEIAPKTKVKYGVSEQNVDRLYATREPSEYSVGYQELGAKPRKSVLLDSFDEFLRRQTYK